MEFGRRGVTGACDSQRTACAGRRSRMCCVGVSPRPARLESARAGAGHWSLMGRRDGHQVAAVRGTAVPEIVGRASLKGRRVPGAVPTLCRRLSESGRRSFDRCVVCLHMVRWDGMTYRACASALQQTCALVEILEHWAQHCERWPSCVTFFGWVFVGDRYDFRPLGDFVLVDPFSPEVDPARNGAALV